jgi:hypothetical protein
LLYRHVVVEHHSLAQGDVDAIADAKGFPTPYWTASTSMAGQTTNILAGWLGMNVVG